ncbi:MAG: helix-turn-helix transcriptional regulator [Deltaproteobacteria bacterium]|nr:helix-turn-helix transcriptional regulator [Deltaproteobacteria bacterium]
MSAKPPKKWNCPVEVTLAVIGGKWKTLILWHLRGDKKRFTELRRLMPNVTQRMLKLQLRELEKDGVVERKVHPEAPPKVEYSLTPRGRSLRPVLNSLCKWGSKNETRGKKRN